MRFRISLHTGKRELGTMKIVSDDTYNTAIAAPQGFCIKCEDFTRYAPERGSVYLCPRCNETAVLHPVTAYEQGEFHLESDNLGEEDNDEEDEFDEEDDGDDEGPEDDEEDE